MRAGLPLIKSVLTPLAKSVLIPLGLTAAGLRTDAAIQKKIFGSGVSVLVILNNKLNDIIKIVKSLKESGLRIKTMSETVKMEGK